MTDNDIRPYDNRLLDYTMPHKDQNTKELLLVERANAEIALSIKRRSAMKHRLLITYKLPDQEWDMLNDTNTLFDVYEGEDCSSYEEGWDKLALLHCDGWGIGEIRVQPRYITMTGLWVVLRLERTWGLLPEVIDEIANLRTPALDRV